MRTIAVSTMAFAVQSEYRRGGGEEEGVACRAEEGLHAYIGSALVRFEVEGTFAAVGCRSMELGGVVGWRQRRGDLGIGSNSDREKMTTNTRPLMTATFMSIPRCW
jgi:hypothetical protein